MTILIFLMLKLVNIRSYDAYNYSLTIISSGGFLPNNNFDTTFTTDISKIILSISMLFSFFSLFFIFNLIFFKKKNINYLSEDINILIYIAFSKFCNENLLGSLYTLFPNNLVFDL